MLDGKQDQQLKAAFAKIKEEMEEHLIAINENTDEINTTAARNEELHLKIEKLSERMDELQMMIIQLKGDTITKKDFSRIVLSTKEQEVFTLIYAKNGGLIEYKQIARALGYTELDIEKIINSMIIKGIPVIKRYVEEKVYVTLDSEFRNLQAKENLIKIKESVLRNAQDGL
jgi:DNA-binding MarR family transcriptional regulator